MLTNNLPPWKGLGFHFYNHVLETAPIKRELLAHASTISFLSTLYGNLYSFKGNPSSSYSLIICKSGGGKDAYLKAAKEIFSELELDYSGLGSYRSDSSIIESLPQQRVRLDTQDEASSLFIMANRASSTSQANIPNVLTELWSTKSFYPGMRSLKDGTYGSCHKPCLNYIGAVTESALADSFRKVNMESGFCGRFLFFHDTSRGELNKFFYNHSKSENKDKLLSIIKNIQSLKDSNDTEKPSLTNLPIQGNAQARLEQIRAELYEVSYKTSEDDLMLPVVNRSFEQITRLMVWYAASKNYETVSPIISIDDVEWSYQFITRLNELNKREFFSRLTQSDFEADCKKVVRIIESKGGCITRSILIRNSRLLSGRLNQIINQLVELKEVEITHIDKEKMYRLTSSHFEGSKGKKGELK